MNSFIPLNKDFFEKPAPFEPGEKLFWNDPYISAQMLSNHINPQSDGASRNLQEIVDTVKNIHQAMGTPSHGKLIDIGCGPGLYAEKFNRLGYKVTGIDYSQRSIEYAREQSNHNNSEINYIYGDYTEIPFGNSFDAAVFIYGDYCVLPPESRKALLQKIYHSLNPGGFFFFDVSTPHLRAKAGLENGWSFSAENAGFWKKGQHLVLEQGYSYDNDLFLDQFIVIEANGHTSIYRNWFQDFTKDTILKEINDFSDFQVETVWSDLKGTPYDASSDWIGVLCRK
ncbi:class I SAM-dependent methyltransferase [Cytobacillus horneckiae]|uniref:class I SAM-dependent methyltransferase n=1 Tax=Cytobacillus horneckiae TaxID=549687 RepID=UPI003D9A5212